MSEPFTGLYSRALKDICRSIDDRDFKLFCLMCAYADNRGICWPGVRELHEALGWRNEEVRYRIDRLERQSLLRFLRRNSKDAVTGRFLPDVYQMNTRVLLAKTPVPHTPENAEHDQFRYAPLDAEHDQFRIAPVEHTQPESEPDTSIQNHYPESGTSTTNQSHSPLNGSENGTGNAAYGWRDEGEKPNTNTKANTNTQDSGKSAPAGTKTAPAGHAESNTPPSSAPPPKFEPVPRYINALIDARLEALANEVRALAPTRLYNARELVMKYGEVEVRKGLTQLAAAKAKGNVYSPCGLLTSWLRSGAIKAEPEAESFGQSYVSGQYAEFIEH